jgi:hypothetical protein
METIKTGFFHQRMQESNLSPQWVCLTLSHSPNIHFVHCTSEESGTVSIDQIGPIRMSKMFGACCGLMNSAVAT